MSFGGKPSTPSPKSKPRVDVKSETKPKPRLVSSISSSVGDKLQRTKDVAAQEAESSPRSPVGSKTPPAQKSPAGPIVPAKGLVADNSPSSLKRRTRSSLGGSEDTARGLDFSTNPPKADEKKQSSKVDDKKVTRLEDKKQPGKSDTKKQPVKIEERKPFVTGKADIWSPTMKTSPGKPAEKGSPLSAEKKSRNASPLSNAPKSKAGMENINVGSRGFANSQSPISSKASNLASTNTAAKAPDGPAVVSSSPQSESGKRSSVVEDDTWTCRECGWTYPNAHPSAKHRRNHKKHCAEIKSKREEGVHINGGSSDEASSDDEGSAVSGYTADIVAAPVEGKTSTVEARDSSGVIPVDVGAYIGKDEVFPSSDHEIAAFTDEGLKEQHGKAVVGNGESVVTDEVRPPSEREIEGQGVFEEGSDKQQVYELSPGSPSVKARVEELERKCSNLGDSSLENYGSPSKKFGILRDSPQSSPVKKLLLPEASTLFSDRLHSAVDDGTGHHSKLTPSSTSSEHEVSSFDHGKSVSPVIIENRESMAAVLASAEDLVPTENREATADVLPSAEDVDGTISGISQSESGRSKSIHGEGLTSPLAEKHVQEQANEDILPQNSLDLSAVRDVLSKDAFLEDAVGGTSKHSLNVSGGNEGSRSEGLKPDRHHQELNVDEAEHTIAPLDGGHVSADQDPLPPDSDGLQGVQGVDEQPTGRTELSVSPLLHSEGEPDQSKSKEDSASIHGHTIGLPVGNVEVAEELSHAHVLPEGHFYAPELCQSEPRGLLSTEFPLGAGEDGERRLSTIPDNAPVTEQAVNLDGEGAYHPIGDADASSVEAHGQSNQDMHTIDVPNVASDVDIVRDVGVDVKDIAPPEIPASSETLLGLEDCIAGSSPRDSIAAVELDRTGSPGRPASVNVNGTEDPAEVHVATEATEEEMFEVRTPTVPVTVPNLSESEAPRPNLDSVVRESVPVKADLSAAVASVDVAGGAGDPQASKMNSGRIEVAEAKGAGIVAEVQNSALDGHTEVLDSIPVGDSEISNNSDAVSHDSTTSKLALAEPEILVEAHHALALESPEVTSRRVSFADDARTAEDTRAEHGADASGFQSGVSDDVSAAAETAKLQETIADSSVQHTSSAGQKFERLDDSSQIVADDGFPEREDTSLSNLSVVELPSELPDEVGADRNEPTAHHQAAESESLKEVEDQHAGIGLAKKVEPALSTASAVAIPRSGRESREKELWERLLDHDVKQNATSPTHFFSSEESWQPGFEEKLLQNSALLNADAIDEKSRYGSQGSQIASSGNHVGRVREAETEVILHPDSGLSEVEAGTQAGETLSKAAPRDTEPGTGYDVHDVSIAAQQSQGELDNGLSPHMQGVLPVAHVHQTEEASKDQRSEPKPEASAYQTQSDLALPKQGPEAIVVDADVTESSSKSEVSVDNGVKAAEKQRHRLKNLLEEEHQSELPVPATTEAKASGSPRTSPFLKRIIERVRNSPPNVAVPKDVSKEESSESEVATGRRSIFSCRCFSPVKSN